MDVGSISWIRSRRSADPTSRFGERRLRPIHSRASPHRVKLVDVGSIASYFESLDDPRHTRNRKHLLVDIAVIAVCGIICGCDGPHRHPRSPGPNTANPGWLSTSPCPTASPHATASVARSSCSSPRPSNAASRPGSATRSRSTPANAVVSSPSTAKPVAARTTPPRTSVPCTSSAPGPARRGSPWARSPPTPSPTRLPPFPSSWSRST